MRLIPTLAATAALALSLGLAGCDSADRAALFGTPASAPGVAAASTAAPLAAQGPAVARATLLYPPAAGAHRQLTRAPRRHAHRALLRLAARDGYGQQTVTRRAYGGEVGASQLQRRAEADDRWDERRSEFAEGYGHDGFRGDTAPTSAGRDRDGFLTWPGKVRR